MPADKEIRSDAKLKNLPREVRDHLWRFRNPEEDGEKVRFIDILLYLKGKGIESSLGALSEFFAWERAERRMEGARARAEQARTLLAADPNATPEDVARVGQMVFTSEMVDAGNVKAFVALEKLRMQQQALDHDRRRITLLEANAAQAKAKLDALATAAKSGGGLTPETLRQIEEAAGLL
jgi:hypothetical protein